MCEIVAMSRITLMKTIAIDAERCDEHKLQEISNVLWRWDMMFRLKHGKGFERSRKSYGHGDEYFET